MYIKLDSAVDYKILYKYSVTQRILANGKFSEGVDMV